LPEVLKVMAGYEQEEEPAWQKAGDTQLDTFDTWHNAFVYWIVWPEQVYAGVQD